jgi:hypothetical protein
MRVPGRHAVRWLDFGTIGELSGRQALRILKDRVQPGELPILMQEEPIDPRGQEQDRQFKLHLPPDILDAAQIVDFTRDRMYRIEVPRSRISTLPEVVRRVPQGPQGQRHRGGKNLAVNLKVIDYDLEEAGLWDKMGVLVRIRNTRRAA